MRGEEEDEGRSPIERETLKGERLTERDSARGVLRSCRCANHPSCDHVMVIGPTLGHGSDGRRVGHCSTLATWPPVTLVGDVFRRAMRGWRGRWLDDRFYDGVIGRWQCGTVIAI